MLRHVLLSMHLHLLQVLDGPRSLSRTGTSRRPRPCPCDRIGLASRDLVTYLVFGVRSEVFKGIIPYRRALISLLSRESRTRRAAQGRQEFHAARERHTAGRARTGRLWQEEQACVQRSSVGVRPHLLTVADGTASARAGVLRASARAVISRKAQSSVRAAAPRVDALIRRAVKRSRGAREERCA